MLSAITVLNNVYKIGRQIQNYQVKLAAMQLYCAFCPMSSLDLKLGICLPLSFSNNEAA